MSELTSLAELPVSIAPEQEPSGFQITGGGRRTHSLGGTGGATLESLTTVIQAVRSNTLTAPSELQSLLARAVASRQEREGEEVESWAERVARDAADSDA